MPHRPVSLPNFEDPDDLLTPERLCCESVKHWNRQPLPQGMSWFGKTWYPRMSYVGVTPGNVDANETMREELLGLVPAGHISPASFACHPGTCASITVRRSGLRCTVCAATSGMVGQLDAGRSRRIPPARRPPKIVADIGAGEMQPEVRLYSVVIEPDAAGRDADMGRFSPVSGAAWLPHMKRLAGFVV